MSATRLAMKSYPMVVFEPRGLIPPLMKSLVQQTEKTNQRTLCCSAVYHVGGRKRGCWYRQRSFGLGFGIVVDQLPQLRPGI